MKLDTPKNTPTISDLIARGALFVANHSGGKDSQAMLIELLRIIPREQLLVVHASLGEIEWDGALELAQKQASDAGLPFIVARAVDKTGAEKTLFSMVEHRFATRPDAPSWPSAKYRACTGELKTQPIEREVRRYMRERGLSLVVNCVGIRAAESPKRAKAVSFKLDADNSVAGREWYNWLPIHDMSTDAVFATIRDAGQEPHPAYAAGNQRLSCVFCIMGSKNDLIQGAKARPDLLARYVELEERTGYTMHESRRSLREIVGQAASF